MNTNLFADFPREMKKFVSHGHFRMGYVTRISDGDTVIVFMDREFYDSSVIRIRLKNINSQEMNTDLGRQSRDFVVSILPTGTPVLVRTFKQTYDRYEGEIQFMHEGSLQDLGTIIVKEGHATWI